MTNWLHKICQAKPLPAPFIDQKQSREEGDGLLNIYRKMQASVSLKEEERHKDMRYLGHGLFGLVYDLNNGHVLKYTDKLHEVINAKRLINNPIPCAVKVYNTKRVQTNSDLWSIESEKIEKLSREDAEIVDLMLDYYPELDLLWEHYPEFKGKEHIAENYQSLITCLQKHGLLVTELHGKNVGWVDGRLVLLDLG